MRTLIAAALLVLLPTLAQGRTVDGDALKHCEAGDDDATAWIAACSTAIATADPADRDALSISYTNRGFADINLALQTDHDFSRAVADLTEAIHLDPDDAVAYLNRANAWWYAGEDALALVDIDSTLQRDAGQGKAYALRCKIYTKTGRVPDAIADCKRAMTLDDDTAYTADILAQAYEAAGDTANAIAQYRRAARLDPDGRDGKRAVQALERLGAGAQ